MRAAQFVYGQCRGDLSAAQWPCWSVDNYIAVDIDCQSFPLGKRHCPLFGYCDLTAWLTAVRSRLWTDRNPLPILSRFLRIPTQITTKLALRHIIFTSRDKVFSDRGGPVSTRRRRAA